MHGTAFDVNGYKDDESIEVSLLRGHVSISATDGKLLVDMQPNQKAIIRKDDFSQNQLIACDADTEGIWRYNKLKIEDEPLETVCIRWNVGMGCAPNLLVFLIINIIG